MRLNIIMYHYVRDPGDTDFPAVPAVDRTMFQKHLAHLGAGASFVSASDVVAAVRGERDLPEQACLLTFDDGLKEHAAIVAPLLAEQKIPAVFFPILGCVGTGQMIDTHKTHALLATLGTDGCISAFHDWLRANHPDRFSEWEITDRERKSQSRHDDVLTGNFKATIKSLEPEMRTAFFDAVFEKHLGSESAVANAWYVSSDDLRTMADLGMEIGSHGWDHLPYKTTTTDVVRFDIVQAKDALTAILGERAVPMFCYPYGSYAPATIDLIAEIGYSCAVTVEVGSNTDLSEPFQLKRYDASDVLSL